MREVLIVYKEVPLGEQKPSDGRDHSQRGREAGSPGIGHGGSGPSSGRSGSPPGKNSKGHIQKRVQEINASPVVHRWRIFDFASESAWYSFFNGTNS